MEFIQAPSSDELVALRDASVFCIDVAYAYHMKCFDLPRAGTPDRIAVKEVEWTALLREQYPFIERACQDWRKNAAATTLDWVVMARGRMKPVRHCEFVTSTAHEMGFKLIEDLNDVMDTYFHRLIRDRSEFPVTLNMQSAPWHLLDPSFLSHASGFDRDQMVAEVRLEHASARRLLIDKGFATPSPMVSTDSDEPARDEADSSPSPADFVPEPDDLMILKAHTDTRGVAMTIVEIKTTTGISLKTVGIRLARMLDHGLVARPPERKKRTIITDKGRRLQKSIEQGS